MKKVLVFVVCAASLMSIPSFAAGEQEALSAWNALEKSLSELKAMMSETVSPYAPNVIGEDEEAIGILADYDKTIRPRVTKLLAEVTVAYGAADKIDDAFKAVIDIDWRSGKHPTTPASKLYGDLSKAVENIAQARINRTEILLQEAESLMDSIQRFPAWVTDENFAKLKTYLKHAHAFDPENSVAREWLAKVDTQQKEAVAAIEKRIDEARWPGHNSNFAGPGNPDELAKAALEWIQNDEKNAGRRDHTFAVAVRGDWVVAKRDILGRTLQWGLPIWAACFFPEEQERGVCRVFSLTILTREGGPDIAKAPPFTYTWVGDMYEMRIANIGTDGVVQKVRGAAKAPRAERATQKGRADFGAFRIILRIALVAANLLAGMLAAASIIRAKVPKAGAFYKVIEPYTRQTGAVILITGLVVLLFDMLRLRPLANILPVLTAGGAGLLFGKEQITAWTDNTRCAQATAVFFDKSKSLLDLLAKQKTVIGLACLVFGLLHLFFGGVVML